MTEVGVLGTTATSTEERDRGAKIAVLPVGSFEQHGGILPLTTDTIVAVSIASALSEAYGLLQLPPVTMSCSHEHAGFAGTVSISAATLGQVVGDIAASLAAQGIRHLAVVNGHGGNYVLQNVVQEANVEQRRMLLLFPTRSDWARARVEAGMSTSATEDMHGGELETSLLLHVAPQTVRPEYTDGDWTADDRPYLHTLGIRGYTDSGIIGRPSLGTADKGQLLLESLTRIAKEHLDLFSE